MVKERMATFIPIYSTALYQNESPEGLADVFNGKKFDYIYSRIPNLTAFIFKQLMNNSENGIGAIATSSGMSAIATVIVTLVDYGDEIMPSRNLFEGTLLFFNEFIKRYSVKVNYVDACNIDEYKEYISNKTRLIFIETIANPSLNAPDIKAVAGIAKEDNIPLVVEIIAIKLYLFKAKDFGVNIIVHYASKYLTKNGTIIRGVLVNTGNFNWIRCKSSLIEKYARKYGEFIFLDVARKNIFQNRGFCLSPFSTLLICIGLETLSLRMEKYCKNAEGLANYFSKHQKIREVNYSGLRSSLYYAIAKKQFNNKFGDIIMVANRWRCFKLIKKLKLIKNVTNIGNSRILKIHPGSTIFHECSKEEKKEAKVTDDILRVSVDLEDIEYIINDFDEGLREV